MRAVLLWIVRIIGGLLFAIVVFFAVLGVRVTHQLSRRHVVQDVAISVPTDSTSIARGQHLSVIFSCQGCHGPDLAGGTLFDVAAVGRVHSPNLTRDGITKDFTPSD